MYVCVRVRVRVCVCVCVCMWAGRTNESPQRVAEFIEVRGSTCGGGHFDGGARRVAATTLAANPVCICQRRAFGFGIQLIRNRVQSKSIRARQGRPEISRPGAWLKAG